MSAYLSGPTPSSVECELVPQASYFDAEVSALRSLVREPVTIETTARFERTVMELAPLLPDANEEAADLIIHGIKRIAGQDVERAVTVTERAIEASQSDSALHDSLIGQWNALMEPAAAGPQERPALFNRAAQSLKTVENPSIQILAADKLVSLAPLVAQDPALLGQVRDTLSQVEGFAIAGQHEDLRDITRDQLTRVDLKIYGLSRDPR